MRSLCTAGSTSGMPPNSMRSAAPRAAGLRVQGGVQVLDGFSGFGEGGVEAARGRRAGATFSSSRLPSGLAM